MPLRSPLSTREDPDKEMQNVSLFTKFNIRELRGVPVNAFCLFAIITLSGYELLQRFQKVNLKSQYGHYQDDHTEF